jgi:hypothetical protein
MGDDDDARVIRFIPHRRGVSAVVRIDDDDDGNDDEWSCRCRCRRRRLRVRICVI